MLKCVKCKTEVNNSLLCDNCMEKDMGKDGSGGIMGGPLGQPSTLKRVTCIECNSVAVTLKDGICNTCLSKKDDEDMIEWPKHYNSGKIQPIDVIEDWNLDFRLATALKYIARAGKKDPTKTKEDLEKSIWYVQRFIDKELNDE